MRASVESIKKCLRGALFWVAWPDKNEFNEAYTELDGALEELDKDMASTEERIRILEGIIEVAAHNGDITLHD